MNSVRSGAGSRAAVPLVLGLDVGTSAIKALLVDRAGRQSGHSSTPTPFEDGAGGTEMTVEALYAAVARALEGLAVDRSRVVAVGIAGLAESGAVLDAAGDPLAPIIAWHDPRGAETVAVLEDHFGADLAFLIGQRVRPVSSVAKLGWLVDNGVFGLRRWLGVPELCLFRLTGAEATEHSLAARTGCYDVGRLRWLPEVAKVAGFAIDAFPPVRSAGAVMGRVSRPGSRWSGLPEGAPVTLAGHDHLAGADGCGADEGDLVNSVGTAETVIGRSRRLPDRARALSLGAAVTVRPGGVGWATLASAARSGIVLGEVAALLALDAEKLDELAAITDAIDVPGVIEAVARGERPVLPPGPPGPVWGGILRALTGRAVGAADRVMELTGPSGRLVVFGGGSRSRPWLRAKAAAATAQVWRSTAEEAVSRGAALRAGMAAGWWPSLAEAPTVALERIPAS